MRIHRSSGESWTKNVGVSTYIFIGLIMSLVPILESKSQNGTQIFKSLKLVPFFVKTSHVCPFREVKIDVVRRSVTCQFLDF